ncbi:hypothetical protein B0T13DRAFT_530870 [Neurospora crassa]|nr:hypothetical protein B0T13DRAFT_530870 [Neurospora crassa]
MSSGSRNHDLRSKAVSPDRWRDPGLLFRRDSESSVASSYHSTPTNGSPQIRPTILEAMNLPLTPYPDSSAASSQLSPLPEVPETPSSTLGQFGDLARKLNPSAAELVQKVHKSWRSQSREGHSRVNESHSRTRSGRHHSHSRSRSEQRQGREGSREALESRERSLSRSTLQASIDLQHEREHSLSRSSTQASLNLLKDREREKERERERDMDRSQTSSHRRAASSKELRLLAHERSYDNDREIAATKVNMYLQSLAAQTPQPMPSPPQSNASHTPKPQSSATPKPTNSQTPIPTQSHTPIPGGAHTPIPSMSHTPIPMAASQTPVSATSHTPISATMQMMADPDKELLQENRGLYQRVAALQRTERDLLAENQELVRQLAVFKKHHENRHQQWKDEFQKIKEREKILLVEAQQLKAKIMRQEEQILDLAVANAQIENPSPGLTDKQITSWFAERDESWFSWAQNFASRDPNRLSSGLHPLQLYEVCDGVKTFVKLTDDFKLPNELLVKGTDMIQAVLHGMLANFICTESLASPFWIFNAISSAMLNAIPSRSTFVSALKQPAPPRDSRFPPPLITANLSADNVSASSLAYPMKAEMENMFHMLTKAQTAENGLTSVQLREAQLVQLFADSGMSLKSPSDSGGVEAKRMLIESRLNYARRLKERFLSGAARFLLQDQDPAGIAALERSLTEHIDDALRFSVQLWARPGPIRFHGFQALGNQKFKPDNRLMGLCHAQMPKEAAPSALPAHLLGQVGPETPGPPGYYDGRPVIMVVQPAVEGIEVGGGGREDDSKPRKISRVWMKARVLVATTAAQGQTATAPTAGNLGGNNIAPIGGTTAITNMTLPDLPVEKTLLLGPVPKLPMKALPNNLPQQQQVVPMSMAGYYTQCGLSGLGGTNVNSLSMSMSVPLEKVPASVTLGLPQENPLRTA